MYLVTFFDASFQLVAPLFVLHVSNCRSFYTNHTAASSDNFDNLLQPQCLL